MSWFEWIFHSPRMPWRKRNTRVNLGIRRDGRSVLWLVKLCGFRYEHKVVVCRARRGSRKRLERARKQGNGRLREDWNESSGCRIGSGSVVCGTFIDIIYSENDLKDPKRKTGRTTVYGVYFRHSFFSSIFSLILKVVLFIYASRVVLPRSNIDLP